MVISFQLPVVSSKFFANREPRTANREPRLRLRDRHRRRPQHIVANRVAVPDDADDPAVVFRGRCRNGADGFVPEGIERHASDSMRLTPRPSSFDRNCRRTISTPCRSASGDGDRPRGLDRAIEIVHNVEEIRQDLAAAALDVLGDLAAQPQPRLFEFTRGLAVFGDVFLRDPILLGELMFELFDVGRLVSVRLARRRRRRAPTSADRRP